MKITRRSFLKGALAAGMTAVGMLGPAKGWAYPASSDEKKPDGTWMDPPEEVTRFRAVYDADVCVCGRGFAGLAVCRELAEQGRSVLLLEQKKEEDCRANGTCLAALNAGMLLRRGIPYADPVGFCQDHLSCTGNQADPGLVMKYAKNSGENIDWFLSGTAEGDPRPPVTPLLAGAERTGTLKYAAFSCFFPDDQALARIQAGNQRLAEENGARVLFETVAQYVRMERGIVTGVIAKCGEDPILVRCRAAVLACGGFGGNKEMLKTFYPPLRSRLKGFFPVDEDGMGLRMGLWAGGLAESTGIPILDPSPDPSLPHALWLDPEGRRFCNEFSPDHGSCSRARDGFYMVFDSHLPDYRSFKPWVWGNIALPEETEILRAEMEAAGSPSSRYAKGNTLEELTDSLGLSGTIRDTFLASVARYNTLCENGRDEDHARPADALFPVTDGPFYAVRYSPRTLSPVTLGGLVTDSEQNVLDQSLCPIPGLYASGNTCGGRFGPRYQPPMPGMAMGMAIVLGRECGRSVSGYLRS